MRGFFSVKTFSCEDSTYNAIYGSVNVFYLYACISNTQHTGMLTTGIYMNFNIAGIQIQEYCFSEAQEEKS